MIGRWPFTVKPEGGSEVTRVGYAIDPLHDQFMGPNSVALMRAQADTSNKPNEGSLNREDFWRRTISSWHLGAGQLVYDDEQSDPSRFYESAGVDVWTKNQISLLPEMIDMPGVTSVARHPRKLLVAEDREGTWLYYIDENSGIRQFWSSASGPPVYPDNISDFNVLTGSEVILWSDMATDGYYIYASSSLGGIYRFANIDFNVGGVEYPLLVDHLWYARNRLMASTGPALYNILNSSTSDPIYTHPNPEWTWNGVAEAGSYIYVSGSAGRVSAVYKTTVSNDEAVSLEAPIVAVQLPDGEVVQTIYGYAGFILIGTSLGVRLAQPDGNGFLTFGPLLEIGLTTAFEGDGKFVWAGTSDNDPLVAKTYLWRLNLQEFTLPLAPAYARDLDSPTPALAKAYYIDVWVGSIVSFLGKRYFIQSNNINDEIGSQNHGHFYMESGNLVDEGYVRSGLITFGMSEAKRLVEVVVNHRPLPGPAATVISGDTTAQLSLVMEFDSTSDAMFDLDKVLIEDSTSTTFHATTNDGEPFDLRWGDVDFTLWLRSEDADKTVSPVVRTVMVKARPTPDRSNLYVIPIIISDNIRDLSEQRHKRDATGMMEAFMDHAASGARLDMTLLGHTFQGYVEDYQFEPEQIGPLDDHFIGTLLIRLREVD